MAFLETPRLDPLITQGATSTSDWNRVKTYSISGRLKQQFNWADEINRLQLEYRPRPLAEYHLLRDYFKVVMANACEGFRAKDWSDFQLTEENSTLAFISGFDWQICRVHTAGALQYLRPVAKPVAGIVILNEVSADAGASIDTTTGIATIPGSADTDVYTAVGEFDLPVTFANDAWVSNLKIDVRNLWLSAEPIVLEEIRL